MRRQWPCRGALRAEAGGAPAASGEAGSSAGGCTGEAARSSIRSQKRLGSSMPRLTRCGLMKAITASSSVKNARSPVDTCSIDPRQARTAPGCSPPLSHHTRTMNAALRSSNNGMSSFRVGVIWLGVFSWVGISVLPRHHHPITRASRRHHRHLIRVFPVVAAALASPRQLLLGRRRPSRTRERLSAESKAQYMSL